MTPAHGEMAVLVVDDNRDAADMLRDVLELAGHHVEVAYDGEHALEHARRLHPALVLCDIGLPAGMDGYAVARAIRADRELRGAYLVALTGYGRKEDRDMALAAGFDDHLTKPVDLARIERLVRDRNARAPDPPPP